MLGLADAEADGDRPASRITQSTPLTVTQRSVVGPGEATPQRSTTAEGSPHAAVAWLVVFRSAASPIESGSAIISGAHAGFAASGAASTDTAVLHALSEAVRPTANASAEARSTVPVERLFARRRRRGMVLLGTDSGVPSERPGPFKTTRLRPCPRSP